MITRADLQHCRCFLANLRNRGIHLGLSMDNCIVVPPGTPVPSTARRMIETHRAEIIAILRADREPAGGAA